MFGCSPRYRLLCLICTSAVDPRRPKLAAACSTASRSPAGSKGGAAKYRVENGEIVGTSVPNTGNSFLCTEKDYGDFVLELEFKVDPALNSGVQIRSQCFDEPKEIEKRRQEGEDSRRPRARLPGRDRSVGTGLERRHLRRRTARLAERSEEQRSRPQGVQARRVEQVSHRVPRRFDQDLAQRRARRPT